MYQFNKFPTNFAEARAMYIEKALSPQWSDRWLWLQDLKQQMQKQGLNVLFMESVCVEVFPDNNGGWYNIFELSDNRLVQVHPDPLS